ncbi:MAG: nickel pincer cofactor biosynthesis protein LarB [Chloroflexi bacterium]|nr:nickel pincer cofactor biosynthesis protein LarB [Chloroflexota bacterium]
MDTNHLSELLLGVRDGNVPVEEALGQLRLLPYQDLGFAKVDHHRALRRGFPEVVFGPGKSPQQIATIVDSLAARNSRVLVTKVSPEAYALVKQSQPQAVYHELARAITIGPQGPAGLLSGVSVVCAGTADLPVAEEAAVTATAMGNAVDRHYDVGVAGLHRLLDAVPSLQRARAIVVVAGMEGALPSIIGGITAAPVIAVPTSIGYGASFGGLAPLLAMLNSCTPGLAVVNIDNGFGAGYLAALINLMGGQPGP